MRHSMSQVGESADQRLDELCRPARAEAVGATVHQLAESLSRIIDAKDHTTRHHSDEVADVVKVLGRQLGVSRHQLKLLHVAGHLHDIGKVGVRDSVLKKKGPLTRAEFEEIKRHPVLGAEIIEPITSFTGKDGIMLMVRHHHERFDGSGYPEGLTGEAIPFGARVIAVADSLSAMLQDRPYREAMKFDAALEEIQRCSGTQFDPKVVDALLACTDRVQECLHACRRRRAAA